MQLVYPVVAKNRQERLLRHNAPFWFNFWFRHYIYYLLVYIVCFPTYPFSSPFPYLSPYLSFPLRTDPLRFQAGCCRRRLNLALVFCVYFVEDLTTPTPFLVFPWNALAQAEKVGFFAPNFLTDKRPGVYFGPLLGGRGRTFCYFFNWNFRITQEIVDFFPRKWAKVQLPKFCLWWALGVPV